MPNSFKLSFSGLCAFVPKLAPGQANNQMRVLLVDARGFHPPHGPHTHVHHEPVLVAQQARIDHSSTYRQPDGSFTSPAGVIYEYFLLADRDLEIVGTGMPNLEFELGTVTSCPTQMNERSFEWVIPIDLVTPGSGTVRAACLSSGGHGSIAARVLLKQGKVSVTKLADDGGPVLQWEFKPVGTGGTPASSGRALAERVQLDFPFPGTDVMLQTTYFRNFSGSQIIRLIPVNSNGDLEVSARVMNLPWPSTQGMTAGPHVVDYHFEHFYPASTYAGTPNVPHPIASPSTPCLYKPNYPPSPETPLCPPTRFAPNSAA